MNQDFGLLRVGQYVPGCRTHGRFVRADHRDGMWRVFAGVPWMTRAELEALRGGTVRFAAALQEENLFFLLRFGGLPWVCAPFEPRVCADREWFTQTASGLAAPLALVGIDSETGVAQTIRLLTMEAAVSDRVTAMCRALLALPYDRASALKRQAAVLRRYPTGEDLLCAADPDTVCVLLQE